MIAALVDTASGNVLNVIVVDSLNDPAPDGQELIAVPDQNGVSPSVGYTWTQDGGFIDPVGG